MNASVILAPRRVLFPSLISRPRLPFAITCKMDISDILASVSAPSISHKTLDLQALTRAWINERSSPELLPYPEDLIERSTQGVKSQVRQG